MKTDLPQKLKTGIFVIAGIGLLVLAIFLIGNQKNLFNKTFTVNANFRNVAGLQIGNAVRFGGINVGINVGTVSDITILNDSIVQVSLRLQSFVHKFIKQDAIANIGSDGLMGDKIIQVSSGTPQTAIVKDNSLINGKDPMNMDQVMTKLNGISH